MSLTDRQQVALKIFSHKDVSLDEAYSMADDFISHAKPKSKKAYILEKIKDNDKAILLAIIAVIVTLLRLWVVKNS